MAAERKGQEAKLLEALTGGILRPIPRRQAQGSIIAGSSTRQQAAREADAVGLLGTRFIRWLLARRKKQSGSGLVRDVRGRRGGARSRRVNDPASLSIRVTALWSNFSENRR